MPIISISAPNTNPASAPLGMGTSRKHSSVTSPTMGATLEMASRHFSLRIFFALRRLREKKPALPLLLSKLVLPLPGIQAQNMKSSRKQGSINIAKSRPLFQSLREQIGLYYSSGSFPFSASYMASKEVLIWPFSVRMPDQVPVSFHTYSFQALGVTSLTPQMVTQVRASFPSS